MNFKPEQPKNDDKNRRFLDIGLRDIHRANQEYIRSYKESGDSSVEYFVFLQDYIEHLELSLDIEEQLLGIALEDGRSDLATNHRESIEEIKRKTFEIKESLHEVAGEVADIESNIASTDKINKVLEHLDRLLAELITRVESYN